MLLCTVDAQAQPYTAWVNEYDGSSPNTLALYNFTQDSPGSEFKNTASATLGDFELYFREGNSQTTPANSQIGASFGKWGSGLDVTPIPHPGRSGMYAFPNNQLTADVFPSGSEPDLTVEGWFRFDNTDNFQSFLVDKLRFDNNAYLLYRYK